MVRALAMLRVFYSLGDGLDSDGDASSDEGVRQGLPYERRKEGIGWEGVIVVIFASTMWTKVIVFVSQLESRLEDGSYQ